ncbi:hypothetical protein BDV95DRAFT_603100 [Massariosphaeria phaeospora]|uniref:Uncharacterized protein n=1 Tax=Massariosphaeria phaeospora TaxID=100035 RepID=A0A7C8IFP6_9PLEO|nr:hypothetical protein BDV95DRAFT_603100 [Massariosphaeria phaeospora]
MKIAILEPDLKARVPLTVHNTASLIAAHVPPLAHGRVDRVEFARELVIIFWIVNEIKLQPEHLVTSPHFGEVILSLPPKPLRCQITRLQMHPCTIVPHGVLGPIEKFNRKIRDDTWQWLKDVAFTFPKLHTIKVFFEADANGVLSFGSDWDV